MRRVAFIARQSLRFTTVREHVLPWLQAGLLVTAWAAIDWLCRRYTLPLPSGILAMLLLLATLGGGVLPGDWLRSGAGRLLAHMLLFFVPVLMVPLAHPELFGILGLKILVIITA